MRKEVKMELVKSEIDRIKNRDCYNGHKKNRTLILDEDIIDWNGGNITISFVDIRDSKDSFRKNFYKDTTKIYWDDNLFFNFVSYKGDEILIGYPEYRIYKYEVTGGNKMPNYVFDRLFKSPEKIYTGGKIFKLK